MIKDKIVIIHLNLMIKDNKIVIIHLNLMIKDNKIVIIHLNVMIKDNLVNGHHHSTGSSFASMNWKETRDFSPLPDPLFCLVILDSKCSVN